MNIEDKLECIVEAFEGTSRSICLVELSTLSCAAKELREYKERPMESLWIDVKDKLPEKTMSTLICTNAGAVCIATFHAPTSTWLTRAGKNTRYWMPVPNPPDRGDR